MKIGVRIMPRWLQYEDDRDLRFLAQIGVDCVDINLGLFEAYRTTGRVPRAELEQLIERLARHDLRIERVANLGHAVQGVYLDEPEAAQRIDALCETIETLGAYQLPILSIPPFSPAALAPGRHRAAASREGNGRLPPFDVEAHGGVVATRARRGGYGHPRYDGSTRHPPASGVTLEREVLWERLLGLYRQVVPVAERAGVRLSMHGNDPPLDTAHDLPQLPVTHDDFARLFREVPSPANTMEYCVGTRHVAGESVIDGIRRFGAAGRISHVHFRNVAGTLPRDGGYAETFIDDGELDMAGVLDALAEVGYDRALDFDHVYRIVGDSEHAREYVAFAVGYIRGLLHARRPRVDGASGGRPAAGARS